MARTAGWARNPSGAQRASQRYGGREIERIADGQGTADDAGCLCAPPQFARRIAEQLRAMAHRAELERESKHLGFAAGELAFRIDPGDAERRRRASRRRRRWGLSR